MTINDPKNLIGKSAVDPPNQGVIAPLNNETSEPVPVIHPGNPVAINQQIYQPAFIISQICAASNIIVSLKKDGKLVHQNYIGEAHFWHQHEDSIFSQAILTDQFLEISDTLIDPFLSTQVPFNQSGIRFLISMPMRTRDGQIIGRVTVLDKVPKKLPTISRVTVQALVGAIASHIELDGKENELQNAAETITRMEFRLNRNSELLRKVEREKEELEVLKNQLENLSSQKEEQIESLSDKGEIYSLVVNSSNDGLWDWDLGSNQISFCNRWKAILGFQPHEIDTKPDEWFGRIHPDDIEMVESDVTGHLLGLTPQFQSEHRVRHSNGNYRWVICRGMALWDNTKGLYRMAGSMTDVTEQKEIEQQLLHNAFHDALTGLPNRTLFMNKLKRSLTRTQQQEDYHFAILFLDLDRFKVVNDSLGHQLGDLLLSKLARRLEKSVRPGDIVARLGGDEFAVILENINNITDATHTAMRVQQELALPFDLGGSEVFISASIGISHSLIPINSPEDFLRNADTAMYRAKERGRGGFELFDLDMQEKESAKVQLEVDLRRALAHNEFELHYQPIISLDCWKITGFEALIRWNHPGHGFISPLKFIPIAEETGLVIKIGQWVIREACKQLKFWQERFQNDTPLCMSVNLSAKQFSDVNLINIIQQIILESAIDPSTLKIEITESAIIENIDLATEVINQLKKLGVKISLDDFGTGYSSLSYLHRFPIDTLKIDRSFVTRMNMPKNCEIVSTILTLANNLGLDVIAEGVETKEQILQLTGMKCDYVQGYLLSRPMNGEDMTKLIEETYHKGIGQTHIGLTEENIS
ncbi:MAG: EAL domain-containing protein [Acidobacteriota bacterium]